MKIRKLDWDSDFFGVDVWECVLEEMEQMDAEMVFEQFEEPIFVYVKSKEKQQALTEYLMDEKVVLSKKGLLESNELSALYKPNSNQEYNALLDLAYQAGHDSRFKKDQFLSQKFKDLYQLWIDRTLTGDFGDGIVVKRVNGTIGGMITFGIDKVLTIGLIAVDHHLRGKQIGNWLLAQVEAYARNAGCNEVRVATQRTNEFAIRFYQRNSYSECEVEYIYHLNFYENSF